jgi:hypothetical protein
MKTRFSTEEFDKGGRSDVNQLPNVRPGGAGEILRDGQNLKKFYWLPQSRFTAVRGRNESDLMNSQLG